MYATTIRFVLGPDTQWESEHIADVVAGMLSNQRGCESFVFLGDYEIGEYEWIVFWNSREDAAVAYEQRYSQFCAMIGDGFQWRPAIQLFQVYDAKYTASS
ncbi:hypothetical protein [Alicyclobacillus sp. ALC3]|uniref:hypothetical protein n=1 Tax=Alicyclobacillus sp. ALC3 TaxID=2796143 RepID=UPI002378FA30|nr:hypothetical protein [Alicyclobacillus sp. ALC3]WDL96043.1 hypothetical protein JC200_17095 [Alicyclobacillus sp. ALC3]